jgi:predicted secreted acid phosphatase
VSTRMTAHCTRLTLVAVLAMAVAVLALLALGAPTHADEPAQPASYEEIVAYHDSGEWDADIAAQVRKARRFVAAELRDPPERRRPAIVFDIDDTALSSYECMKRSNFEHISLAGCVLNREQETIVPALSLYRFALRRRVAVHFITGRPEEIRAHTEDQLNDAGFDGRHTLYMRRDGDAESAAPEKTRQRRRITRRGHRILANLGDQRSDLVGGFAARRYKLPNPMYHTP